MAQTLRVNSILAKREINSERHLAWPGCSVLYWPLRFCFIFLVHVLKRAVKMNFRTLHMENGGSCAHVWCLRLPYFVFHWVLGERISHVLFLSCVSQPSRASRNYHCLNNANQISEFHCLNNANKWRVYLRLGQALSNDNHNQMLKAPPDLLTFLKLIFGDTNSSLAANMHVLS